MKSPDAPLFVFGTKGETLRNLQPLVKEAIVSESDLFTVEEWVAKKQHILHRIKEKFSSSKTVAVRSSALVEDGPEDSKAGAFLSLLNVNCMNKIAIEEAVNNVAAMMTGNQRDQILIQPMLRDIAVSGVIMTFDIIHGAPYYCIDFDDESGRTDSITSGQGAHKNLFVYRSTNVNELRSNRVASFIKLARELESICQYAALDIEFGMNENGQLFLLQVRRITLARKWHPVTERRVKRDLIHIENFLHNCSKKHDSVLGNRTILGVMPDWNPAEIIGIAPRPLAASLYRYLITQSVWCHARASMGYRSLGSADLMVMINHRPYIDVRNSFNSFLPITLPEEIGEKLIHAWLTRLEAFPEFHDKIEFEIVPTCLDFCFKEDFIMRYPKLLDIDQFAIFQESLTQLTRNCLISSSDSTLERALKATKKLDQLQLMAIENGDGYSQLQQAHYLLTQCQELGTFSFAVVARHAFIAEALLRSAVRRGVLSEVRFAEFKRSIHTVTRELIQDTFLVCNKKLTKIDFYKKYGHLRPGTYEITSLRYDERDDFFLDTIPITMLPCIETFALSNNETVALEALLDEANLNVVTAQELLHYAEKAIAGREYVKFIFTRSLSDALSKIISWGGYYGLSRDDISYLEWQTMANFLSQPIIDDVDRYYIHLADNNRKSMLSANSFKFGHLIFKALDIYVATLNRSVPNFIGVDSVMGKIIQLTTYTSTTININNHIVCIENADPGFDWLFTKRPKAIITCFGGANSHMAVRSAELNLPAAIGCGEQIYQRIIKAGSVELNCLEKILRPLYVY